MAPSTTTTMISHRPLKPLKSLRTRVVNSAKDVKHEVKALFKKKSDMDTEIPPPSPSVTAPADLEKMKSILESLLAAAEGSREAPSFCYEKLTLPYDVYEEFVEYMDSEKCWKARLGFLSKLKYTYIAETEEFQFMSPPTSYHGILCGEILVAIINLVPLLVAKHPEYKDHVGKLTPCTDAGLGWIDNNGKENIDAPDVQILSDKFSAASPIGFVEVAYSQEREAAVQKTFQLLQHHRGEVLWGIVLHIDYARPEKTDEPPYVLLPATKLITIDFLTVDWKVENDGSTSIDIQRERKTVRSADEDEITNDSIKFELGLHLFPEVDWGYDTIPAEQILEIPFCQIAEFVDNAQTRYVNSLQKKEKEKRAYQEKEPLPPLRIPSRRKREEFEGRRDELTKRAKYE